MPITINPRKVDVDDSGDNLSGTVHDNAWLQDLQDRIDNAFVRLDASGGSPNIAYKNIDNNFTVKQTLPTASMISGTNGILYFKDTSGAVDARTWRIVQYSDGVLRFEPMVDALTSVQANSLCLLRNGIVACPQRLVVGGLTASASLPAWRNAASPIAMECVTGDNAQWASVRAATFISVNNGTQLADLSTYGGVFPGRVDAPVGFQSSWYLGSHGSYGLYTNTGLYLAGSITAAQNITAGGMSYANGFACRLGAGGALGGNYFNFNWTGTQMQVWADTYMAGLIQLVSDARVKRDFTPLVGSLAKVLQLRPGSFYFRRVNADDATDRDLHLGLLAQDVALVVPELARNTGMPSPLAPDGLWQVNYIELVPLLVAAIQELTARLERITDAQ